MSTGATVTAPSGVPSHQLDNLVNESLPTVKFLASRLASRVPRDIDMEDLVQVGLIGLLQSADRFDPERGVKFQTYAARRVQGAMLDYLRSLDWKPRSVRTTNRKVERAYHEVEQRLGNRASAEDIAEEIGISIPELEQWMETSKPFSCREQWDESRPEPLEALPDPADSPETTVEKQQMQNILARAIDKLPKKERLVLSLYYYEQLTMQEIGDIIGVRQARVSQLHGRAVLRLRNRLRGIRKPAVSILNALGATNCSRAEAHLLEQHDAALPRLIPQPSRPAAAARRATARRRNTPQRTHRLGSFRSVRHGRTA